MDTNSEEYRHQCEVRYFLRIRRDDGRDAVTKRLEYIGQKRGEKAAAALLNDIRQQWERGNRGQQGDWRTE
jgi:hypothetical protein